MDRQAIVETVNSMTSAFAKGDVDGVMAAYESGAVVVPEPGRTVSGNDDLRRMFSEFVARGVNFTYGPHDVVVAGDIALHLMGWSVPGPEGEMVALSVAVLRRQPDGPWKMVIDHPFGDAVIRELR